MPLKMFVEMLYNISRIWCGRDIDLNRTMKLQNKCFVCVKVAGKFVGVLYCTSFDHYFVKFSNILHGYALAKHVDAKMK